MLFLFLELCINDNIKEAFIIGVDEQAKERLNNLTKSKQVTPIDLEELSEQLDTSSPSSSNNNKHQSTALSLQNEYYIVENMVKQQPQQNKSQFEKTSSSSTTSSSLLQIKNKIIHSYNGNSSSSSNSNKRQAPIMPDVVHQLTPNSSLIEQHKSKSDVPLLSSSSSGSTTSSSSTSSTSSTSSKQAKQQQTSTTTTTLVNDIELSVITNNNRDVQQHHAAYTPPITPSTVTSPGSSSISSPALQPTSYVSDDDGHVHREMPIDCPDNFVAEIKVKPKFPPAIITTQTTFTTFKTPKLETKVVKASTPPSQQQNANTSIKYIDDTNSESKLQMTTPNANNSRKLIEKQKQNQNDDAQRKLKDDKENILRNSLRNSEKLKKLEKGKQQQQQQQLQQQQSRDIGNINIGFVNDDLENSDVDHIGMSSSQDDLSSSETDSDNNKHRHKDERTEKPNKRVDSLDEYDSDNKHKKKSAPLAYAMNTIDSGHGGDMTIVESKKRLKTLDITDLFSQVDYIQTKLQQSENKSMNDDILLLRKLYQTSEFQNALVLYNKLVNLNSIKRVKPTCDNSLNLVEDVSCFYFYFNGNSLFSLEWEAIYLKDLLYY